MRGSSPWARGTQVFVVVDFQPVRFIPVGTGNTRFHRQHHLSTAVHPRGHGEHLTFQQRITDRYGSSPWARGTHVSSATQTAALRFIPVGTGNTHLRQSSKPNIAVHPRGHGEHSRLLKNFSVDCGSSPWARGTLSARQCAY